MDSFQQDFINKVQHPAAASEVVSTSAAPKKPLDKRWLIIIGLIVILIITLVVLLVISNSSTSSPTDTTTTLPQGDAIQSSSIASTSWTCTDGASFAFGASTLTITTTATVSEYTYQVANSQIAFGPMSASITGSTLHVLYASGDTTTCRKGGA